MRWRIMFADDIDTVWRARNNVTLRYYISDRNLAAAARMAERLASLVEPT